jgi:hypothetical protein
MTITDARQLVIIINVILVLMTVVLMAATIIVVAVITCTSMATIMRVIASSIRQIIVAVAIVIVCSTRMVMSIIVCIAGACILMIMMDICGASSSSTSSVHHSISFPLQLYSDLSVYELEEGMLVQLVVEIVRLVSAFFEPGSRHF